MKKEQKNREKRKRIDILLLMIFSFILFSYFFSSFSYSSSLFFISQKHNIALNYGDKKMQRILLDPSYPYYSYKILINGKEANSDNFLRVYFADPSFSILSSPISVEKGKKVYLYTNNTIYNAYEIYLVFSYFSPSSINRKEDVQVFLYPLPSPPTHNANVTSEILPSMCYSFNVYLNAYLTSSPSSYTPQTSYSTSYISSPSTSQTFSDTQSPSSLYSPSSTPSLSPLTFNESENEKNMEENNGFVSSSNPSSSSFNESEEIRNLSTSFSSLLNSSSLPTGKATYFNTTSYILILLGILFLVVLWKRL